MTCKRKTVFFYFVHGVKWKMRGVDGDEIAEEEKIEETPTIKEAAENYDISKEVLSALQ